MKGAYLCFFTCQAQKLPLIAILTWFLILGKIQHSDHCWWRHRPPAAPPTIKYNSSCSEDQSFPLKAKLFRNTATRQKLFGGVQSTPPPPPNLYQGGFMNLRVRPRINLESILNKKGLDGVNWQLTCVFPAPLTPFKRSKQGLACCPSKRFLAFISRTCSPLV